MLYALFGGALIGLASALVLFAHGRIAGVSGITASLLDSSTPDPRWRFAFLAGLCAPGVAAAFFVPAAVSAPARSLVVVVVAGLLVGFGTRLGGGCTSGHGVCGIGRFSTRSIAGVVTFMITGALTTLIAGAVS